MCHRQTEQVRVNRALQARHPAGQEAAAGEVAEGGEAGGERGAGRPDQDHRRHARPLRLLARRRPAQGRAVLRGDGPIRQDHPLRQKGQSIVLGVECYIRVWVWVGHTPTQTHTQIL